MNFLLDTNVVSEWVKPRPDPNVIAWLANADEDRVFLSVVTIAELRMGIERLAAGARRARLDEWLTHELLPRFDQRIVPIDESVADTCGRLMAQGVALGTPIAAMDALIAATSRTRKMTLVTRNVSDFGAFVDVLNPWAAGP